MSQVHREDLAKVEFAREQVRALLNAHRRADVLGDRLRAFVLFGPVADGTGYDEIDVLEVVRDWSGPSQGPETVEFTGAADFLLPGYLCLTILRPEQLEEAARSAHPMLQEITDCSGNGDAVLYDPDGLIARATQSVRNRLAQLRAEWAERAAVRAAA